MNEYFLRDWRVEDCHSIVKYANNRLIANNLRDGFPHPYSISDAEKFIENAISQNEKTMFAIANKFEAIGSIGLFKGNDVHRLSAEFGYWLGEPFWNKGIVTNILEKFVKYAFEELKLIRLHAEPYYTNTASIRVLEKAGFQYEGRLRSSVIKNNEILDQLIYAKIRKVT